MRGLFELLKVKRNWIAPVSVFLIGGRELLFDKGSISIGHASTR
jgi:hypothetical protein